MTNSRRTFLKRALAVGTSVSAVGVAGTADSAAQAPGVRGFDHVALPMQNVDAMLKFYRAIGFDVVEGAQVCAAHFGTQMINFHRPSLWQNPTFTNRAPAAKPPCGDLCFVWEGSADSLKAMLAKVPVSIETGPVSRQGGRRAAGSSAYIRDPDNNLLEFIIY